jgi:hypothetical protein
MVDGEIAKEGLVRSGEEELVMSGNGDGQGRYRRESGRKEAWHTFMGVHTLKR